MWGYQYQVRGETDICIEHVLGMAEGRKGAYNDHQQKNVCGKVSPLKSHDNHFLGS